MNEYDITTPRPYRPTRRSSGLFDSHNEFLEQGRRLSRLIPSDFHYAPQATPRPATQPRNVSFATPVQQPQPQTLFPGTPQAEPQGQPQAVVPGLRRRRTAGRRRR